MDEHKNPFGTVDIVLLCIIAGTSDVADLFTDLILPVPVIGQVVYFGNAFLLSPAVWATIQLWFIMKVGFGAPGLVTVAGGILNVAGLPGSQTASTLIAIYLANHPKAAAVATVATGGAALGAATGGAGAVAAESAIATEGAAARTALAEKAGAVAGEIGAEAAGGAGAAVGEEARAMQDPKISGEALGEEKSIFEKMKEPMENFPQPQTAQKEEGESENEGVELDDDIINLKKAA